MITGPHLIAFVRTLATAVPALHSPIVVLDGSGKNLRELLRHAGVCRGEATFEDLRHGQLVFIAASIFLFAVTLNFVTLVHTSGTERLLAVKTPIQVVIEFNWFSPKLFGGEYVLG